MAFRTVGQTMCITNGTYSSAFLHLSSLCLCCTKSVVNVSSFSTVIKQYPLISLCGQKSAVYCPPNSGLPLVAEWTGNYRSCFEIEGI